MITCPFCGTVNEATVRNDVIAQCTPSIIGPVWQCSICAEQWTDDEAEAIIDGAKKETPPC